MSADVVQEAYYSRALVILGCLRRRLGRMMAWNAIVTTRVQLRGKREAFGIVDIVAQNVDDGGKIRYHVFLVAEWKKHRNGCVQVA